MSDSKRATAQTTRAVATPASAAPQLPGQIVLVMQGGGALGAFQAGVYQALHEAGIEPDWVLGTSIGAINAALIAGNAPESRLERLQAFWHRLGHSASPMVRWYEMAGLGNGLRTLEIMGTGLAPFFVPDFGAWLGWDASSDTGSAGLYSTAPLRATLGELIDFERITAGATRLTLGSVNVNSGRMRYFDNRKEPLSLDHVIASGALPPAFPAVLIDGEPYWDGGVYSNTPIEVVMDDVPRRDAVVFAAELWQQRGTTPRTIIDTLKRHKDIQFASRADSHIARQQQIHRLRHVIHEMAQWLPATAANNARVRELLAYGCMTVMHVLPLRTPTLRGEDHAKDIDFSPDSIQARWQAGLEITRQRLCEAPWQKASDPLAGVVVHE